jgi:hypothetical protein
MKIVTKLFNRGNKNSVKGDTSQSPSRKSVKGGTKLSPSGPFWRSRNRIEDDDDDDDDDDDNRIENQSTVTGVVYAAMSSAGVYYEKTFEDTLQSVNQDLYKIFAEGTFLDKTKAEGDSSTDSESIAHEKEKPIKESDNHENLIKESGNHENLNKQSEPTENEKAIGVSDWNELAEEQEVTRDEFLRDMPEKKSENSFLKRYRK